MDLSPIVQAVVGGGIVAAVNHFLTLRQVREVRLHDKRIEVIGRLSADIARGEESLRSAIKRIYGAGEIPLQLMTRANQDIQAARGYFVDNRLFLDLELCAMLDQFFTTANKAISDWWTMMMNQGEESARAYDLAYAGVHSHLPAIRQEIDNRFRKMLGTGARADPDQPQTRRAAT